MMKLINGDVSAVINDKPVTEAYIKKQPDKIKMVGEALNAENYGFAVQKGNAELVEKINNGLQSILRKTELTTSWLMSGSINKSGSILKKSDRTSLLPRAAATK